MDSQSGRSWGGRMSSESGAGEQSSGRLIRDAVAVVRGRLTEVARVSIQPLLQEAATQVRPATVEELRARYPGLTDDEVAQRLIERAARTAAAVALAIGGILAAQEAVAVASAAVPPAGGKAIGAIGVTALAEVLALFVIEAKLRADLGVLAGQRTLTPRDLAAGDRRRRGTVEWLSGPRPPRAAPAGRHLAPARLSRAPSSTSPRARPIPDEGPACARLARDRAASTRRPARELRPGWPGGRGPPGGGQPVGRRPDAPPVRRGGAPGEPLGRPRRRGGRRAGPAAGRRRRRRPRPHPARPEPAPDERPRGARRAEGRRAPAAHPGDRADHLVGRAGRALGLRPPRQRLRHQAGLPRPVHPRHRQHRAVLAERRPPAGGQGPALRRERRPPAAAALPVAQRLAQRSIGTPTSEPHSVQEPS